MKSGKQTFNSQLMVGRNILRSKSRIRSHLLQHWISGGVELHGFANWMFKGLVMAVDEQYYATTSSTELREHLKSLCMGDDSAIAWAESYLARGFPDAGTPFLPMFTRLQQLLATGSVKHAHQVACCSGRELAYYASRFPSIQFTGSDCDDGLVDFLNKHWDKVPNLEFVLVRLEQCSPLDAVDCDLLIASGGLHYMDEQSLQQFFNRAHAFARMVYLSQPMDQDYNGEQAQHSSPRQQLSWNHPYPKMLRNAGWQDIDCEEGFNQDFPGLKNFAAFTQSNAEAV